MPKRRNYTDTEKWDIVCSYIEDGCYSRVAKKHGINGHESVRNIVLRCKERDPERYKNIQDAFLIRQKEELILNNSRTTRKALDKIDELLDDKDATKNVKDAAIAYGILYEKGALMAGESTSNTAVVVKLSGDLAELAK